MANEVANLQAVVRAHQALWAAKRAVAEAEKRLALDSLVDGGDCMLHEHNIVEVDDAVYDVGFDLEEGQVTHVTVNDYIYYWTEDTEFGGGA